MAKAKTVASPIRLNFRSVEQVVVEPDDRDRFVLTMREAARACKQTQDEKDWREQFEEFLIYLQRWFEAHAERIDSAYVDIGDGSLNIFAVATGNGYQFDLEDELSELDIDLVKRFPWCIAEVVQVPGVIRETEISFERAIQVYGDGKRAQTAG